LDIAENIIDTLFENLEMICIRNSLGSQHVAENSVCNFKRIVKQFTQNIICKFILTTKQISKHVTLMLTAYFNDCSINFMFLKRFNAINH
jgi:hypothetical protein